jgi:hypothetical protein
VQLSDFQSLIDRLLKEVPPSYLQGVVTVDVSPKTIPHPVRAEIYTMGECIPLEWSGNGADLQSRVVLYHGSFQAIANLSDPGEFDWREEAWETLTHELRHHLEWRANVAALEAYDWAAEENFKRHEGAVFDPVFYRSGEAIAEGVWKVEEDVFLEQEHGARSTEQLNLVWHGRRHRGLLPSAPVRATLFLVLEGLDEPPPGDAILVVKPRSSVLDLLRRPVAPVHEVVAVEPVK